MRIKAIIFATIATTGCFLQNPTQPTEAPQTDIEGYIESQVQELSAKARVSAIARFTSKPYMVVGTNGVRVPAAAWVPCQDDPPIEIVFYSKFVNDNGDPNYLRRLVAHEVCHVVAKDYKCTGDPNREQRANECAVKLLDN